MKYVSRIAMFILLFFVINQKSIANMPKLSHICAYSNESVVKFRAAMLKSKKIDQLGHPHVVFDWPVDLCEFWISSLFGYRTDKSGVKKMHNGIDMAATKGTLVKSAAAGTVLVAQKDMPGYGNLVEIEHKNGLVTRYAHLDSLDVVVGEKIALGKVIGKVGATGNVRGADPSHLHFEIIKHGKRINPLQYLYWSEKNFQQRKNNVY